MFDGNDISGLIRRGAPASLLAAGFALTASAQTTAGISGTVTDSSGAALSGVTILARSVELGLERGATTDAGGRYEMRSLPIGSYQVTVTRSGFREEVRSGIRLVVGQDAVIPFALQLGAVSEQVTVREDAPVLNASTSDISGLVGAEQVKDLPLNGRSFDLLTALNPGVVNYTSQKTGGTGVSNSTAANDFAVSGQRPQQNIFLLNGIEFTGAAENNVQPGGVSGELLGVDAVREFNILRDNYDVEYGKRPGAQVVIATENGSNELHGSAYEFLRNNALDAPNYFDPGSAPGFQRNQFGGSLGGPLQRDKTFAFGNFEGLTQHLHQTGVDLVPDANARNGFLPCNIATGFTTPCPASGLRQVGVSALINAWPTPTPGAPDFGGISEAFNSPLQTIRDDFGTARVDRVFSSKDSGYAVYTIDDSADNTPTSTNSYAADVTSLREQVASLTETHVFSPTLLNQATVGYSRASYFFTGEPTPGTPAANLPGFLAGRRLGAIVVGGSAASNPAAQLGLAGSNNGSNLDVNRNLYTYQDRVSITKGRHQISLGAWAQQFQSNETLALSQFGQATFTSLQTLLQNTVATFLYSPAPTELNWRALFGAWYAQDTVRLRPDLTATLGFRAESSTGWNEAHGRAATYTYPNGIISTQPNISDNAFTVNRAAFLPEPRVGLAWAPATKTVVHGGFGIYRDLQDALGYRTDQNAPFNPTYTLATVPVAQLQGLSAGTVPARARLVPGGVQPDLNTPTLISWSLRVQQEINPNTTVTVGYVGSHGYHEVIGIDANEPTPFICPNPACPARLPASVGGGAIPAGTYYIPSTAARANPALANTWTYFSRGDSNYDALQVDVNRRFRNGLAFRGVYTWSKTIDDGDSLNATTTGGEPATVSNAFDLRADRGPADWDIRNVGVLNELYALPFGHGQHIGSRLTGPASLFASGWNAESIVSIQGGIPFTPQLSYNPSNNGDTRNPVRPFINPNFHGPVVTGSVTQYFNPAAFLAQPNGSGFYGNLGRNTLTGPGLGEWDLSFLKNTLIRERLNLQFRSELFNILNRANFNQPNAVAFTPTGVSPTAGLITSTATTSRQIQFALKMLW